MKLAKIIVLWFIALFGLIALFFLFVSSGCWEIDGTCLDWVGTLYVSSGSVDLLGSGGKTKTLHSGASLKLADYYQLNVSSDGSAEIVWDKFGRTILAPGTELYISRNSFTYKMLALQVGVILNKGRIWTRIEEPLKSYEYFAVLGVNTVAAAAGPTRAPVSFGVIRDSNVVTVQSKTPGVKAFIPNLLNENEIPGWYLHVHTGLDSGEVSIPANSSISSSGTTNLSEPIPLTESQLNDPFLLVGDKSSVPWWVFWRH